MPPKSRGRRRGRSKSRRTDTRTQDRSRSRDKNRYIMSKEGYNFLQIPKYNDENIELGQYLQSGKFASVYSIKGNPNLVCRITHTFLKDVQVRNEYAGLGIQQELSSVPGLDNIVKIDEYGLYQVSNPEVANKYCKQIPRQDWCILDENAEDEEEQQKEKKKIDAREEHFSGEGNEGIYAVMERIQSDLFYYSLDKLRKLRIEDTIEIIYAVFVQLMRVVSDIHYYGYVHRDIKLENIGFVFDEEGKIQIKLFDFGFAVNTTALIVVKKVGTRGYFDQGLYQYKPLTKKLITPTKEKLEFSDVYACGISMLFMIAIILNKVENFYSIIDKNFEIKQGLILEFQRDIERHIKNKKKQTKLIGVLTIIQNCIVDSIKVLRQGPYTKIIYKQHTAAEILEQLQRLQITSGGKKKTKKKKTNKKKNKKTKKNKTLV